MRISDWSSDVCSSDLMTSCDGCGYCVDICPSDIMHIDTTYRRAYNIEPNMCWECYSCVKACPRTRSTAAATRRSEEHTSELQSLMRTSYAVFCLKKKTTIRLNKPTTTNTTHPYNMNTNE